MKTTYAEVVSSYEGFTLALRLSGGTNAKLEAPFFIFRNLNWSYPIVGCPDNIPGVSYRTKPSGLMDRACFIQWLREYRAIAQNPKRKTRYMYCDNGTGHALVQETWDSLANINTFLPKLLSNATHKCQKLDSFTIQNVKYLWRKA